MRESRVGDVVERFNVRFLIDPVTGCWNWTGSRNKKGYGLIGGEIHGRRHAPKGRRMLAHRVSWIIFMGDIPDSEAAHGTVIRHKCDNPACVNPKHLELGTQADNVKDMYARGRRIVIAKKGADHPRSVFSQEQIDYICGITGRTKELAERFGVSISAVKNVRARNGMGSKTPEKFQNKPLTSEQIAHIRNTPAGTRGLTKLYGISKTAISKIRKNLTHIE